ncbi:DUF2567 domain-containing protein [Rhodococcus sp. NPDC058521]|uniref:DUF2567 domain-containing protein n=1 Tax=Rhodococcus sp. NPDC058521 TaxID=3346536 RepID=UPI00364A51CA
MKDLRGTPLGAAAVAVCAVVVGSALIGIVWGLLAPAEHDLVLSSGRLLPLTGESLHRFDAAALLACAGLVVGIVSAAAVWVVRGARGPLAVAGVLIGSVVGAAVMAGAGTGVAGLRFPEPANLQVGDVAAVATGIGSWLVLIFQPLAACVTTLVLAALNPYDDLGVSKSPDESVDGADSEEIAEDSRRSVG